MRFIKNRKYLAIITVFIILSTTSVVFLFIIVNTPENNSQEQDTILPNVIILSPIQDSTVAGTILIDMNATDVNGISSYAIYIDGVFKSGTKSYSWDATQESDGIHIILCEAFDPSGNKGSDITSVIVNNSGVTHYRSEIFKLMTYNINNSGGSPDWKTVVEEENADIIMFIETGDWDDNSSEMLNQYVDEFNAYFLR